MIHIGYFGGKIKLLRYLSGMHWSHFSPIKFSLHLQVPVDWSQDIPRDPIRLQPQAKDYI